MKRPWLTASLIGTIVVMGALGVRHEAQIELDRGLSRFRAALPPGATFTYASATPVILARGVTLRDVVLQDGQQTFRAAIMRMGHPQLTADGGLSISHLDLRDSVLQGHRLVLQANTIAISHLTLPPEEGVSDQLADVDIGHVSFTQADVGHVTLQNVEPPLPGHLHIYSFGADRLEIEHFGPNDTSTLTLATATAIVGRPLPAQGSRESAFSPFSMQYSMENMTLHQPGLSLLTAALVQRVPLTHLPVGEATFSAQNIQSSNRFGAFRIDDVSAKSETTAENAHHAFTFTGLHLRPKSNVHPPHMDGQHTVLTGFADTDFQSGVTHATTHLAIPDFLTATANTTFGNTAESDADRSGHGTPKPDDLALLSLSVSITGDHFVDSLVRAAEGDTPQPVPIDEARQQAAQIVGTMLAPYTALAPVADYVAAPNGRTLTFSYTPPEGLTLAALGAVARDPGEFSTFIALEGLKAAVQ